MKHVCTLPTGAETLLTKKYIKQKVMCSVVLRTNMQTRHLADLLFGI